MLQRTSTGARLPFSQWTHKSMNWLGCRKWVRDSNFPLRWLVSGFCSQFFFHFYNWTIPWSVTYKSCHKEHHGLLVVARNACGARYHDSQCSVATHDSILLRLCFWCLPGFCTAVPLSSLIPWNPLNSHLPPVLQNVATFWAFPCYSLPFHQCTVSLL